MINATLTQRLLAALLLWAGTMPAMASVDTDNKKIADVLYEEAVLLIDADQNTAGIDLLRKVVELQPDHAGAWLDLAMLHCRIGDAAATGQLLDHVERQFKPNPQIRLVINHIQKTNCDGYAKLSEEIKLTQKGVLRGEFALGVDDNVNQGLSNNSFLFDQGGSLIELQVAPDFRPRSDEFVQTDLSYQKNGFSAYVQMRQNFTEDAFDLFSGFLGYQTTPYLPGANVQFGTVAGALTLGGALYQRTLQVNTHLTPTALQSESIGTRFVLALSRVSYPSLAGADAEFVELGLENIWNRQSYSIASRVDYTFDNALKNRAGGDRTTVGLNLEVARPLPRDYGIRFGVTQKRTLGSDVFSPGFISKRRDQMRSSYGLTLTKTLNPKATLKFQVRKVLNSENIELFEYDNTVAKMSVLWNFN